MAVIAWNSSTSDKNRQRIARFFAIVGTVSTPTHLLANENKVSTTHTKRRKTKSEGNVATMSADGGEGGGWNNLKKKNFHCDTKNVADTFNLQYWISKNMIRRQGTR
jgi:hypothetical protein